MELIGNNINELFDVFLFRFDDLSEELDFEFSFQARLLSSDHVAERGALLHTFRTLDLSFEVVDFVTGYLEVLVPVLAFAAAASLASPNHLCLFTVFA